MIQVLNRAFDIMEFIGRNPKKVYSLTEIADETGLNHATCANILKTLVNRNYVEQLGHKKGYKLGFMVFSLSGEKNYEKEFVQAAIEPMEQVSAELNETCLLAVLKKDRRVCLHEAAVFNELSVSTSVDKEAYNSASGRLLIAMQDTDAIERYVDRYGLPAADIWEGMQQKPTLLRALAAIQKDGIARQRTLKHIVGLAVPIYKNDAVVASLSVYLPESRATSAFEKRIIRSLRAAAKQISQQIG